MKMKVTMAFQSDEIKHLNLGPKKTGSLIDFISVLPVIATKAATRENILFRMHENGMLDKEEARYPVLSRFWQHLAVHYHKNYTRRRSTILLTFIMWCWKKDVSERKFLMNLLFPWMGMSMATMSFKIQEFLKKVIKEPNA